MFWRKYQVADWSLHDLETAGLNPILLESLRGLRTSQSYRLTAFMQMLSELGPRAPSQAEKNMILLYCKRGPMGLERILPWRGLREWIEALTLAFLAALLVRNFLFAPFRIPSGSMIPSILIGDHVFASMYRYGLRLPFTQIRLFSQPVQRGEIIIFPFPENPELDYIKRVIALGGETLEIRDRQVFINGTPLAEPYAFYDLEVLAQLRARGHEAIFDNFGPITVPKGHLFMMGDNRLGSADSRVWGFVKESTVKGKASIVYWSHDPRSGLLGGYHWERLGMLLHKNSKP